MKKIPIGISSCLLGEEVRFDGGHKRDSYITGTLSRYFDFHPLCPEVGIGMSIPRPPIHLIQKEGEIRCVEIKDPGMDVTDQLRDYAERKKHLHSDLCGYILKKDSPSCGMERVKIFSNNMPVHKGSGIYAGQMIRNNPLLPIEEEGRLGDPQLRENFIQRVYVLSRWKTLQSEGISAGRLIDFHAQHKLIIMSCGDCRGLGQLLANLKSDNLAEIANEYISLLMKTLKKVATRKQHVNVLKHIQGYLKKELSGDDKVELCEVIERYRSGDFSLIVPLTLLKHHFRKCPNPYIDNSYYMSPYPLELLK